MPTVNHWKAGGKTPVAMHRSGWNTGEEIFVGFKVTLPPSTDAQLVVLLQPGKAGTKPPAVTSLADW